MTSRRSEDNPTTDDWLAQRNGEYYDSIWPVDSQGRRTPASTQITVTPSSSILDTARAAQAANRERLDRRDNNLLIEKEAVRRIKKEREEEQKDEEGKIISRGVTEGSYYTVLPKRRFGGDFAWIMQEQMFTLGYETFYNGSITTLQFNDDSKLAASKTISQGKIALNSFVYKVDYWSSYKEYFFPPSLSLLGFTEIVPATYDGNNGIPFSRSSLPRDTEAYTSCTIIDQTKTNVVFQFSGSLSAVANVSGDSIEVSTRQRYLLNAGLFVPLQNLGTQAYVYSFVKVEPNTEAPILIGSAYMTRLSRLTPATRYPETVITGNPQNIFITRRVITPSFKQQIAEWFSQGILNYTQGPLNYSDNSQYGFMGHIQMTFLATAAVPEVPADFDNNSRPIPGTYDRTSLFDQTVEIIYTEEDYGPLLLQ
jgi:hypothetical protein